MPEEVTELLGAGVGRFEVSHSKGRTCTYHHQSVKGTMPGTLYKTRTPTTFEDGEYFQPRIEVGFVGGRQMYFVRETHGYFSNTEKRPIHVIKTLSPEEGYSEYKEAEARYHEQVVRRIKDGFVHSFTIDPCAASGGHIVYEYLGGGSTMAKRD